MQQTMKHEDLAERHGAGEHRLHRRRPLKHEDVHCALEERLHGGGGAGGEGGGGDGGGGDGGDSGGGKGQPVTCTAPTSRIFLSFFISPIALPTSAPALLPSSFSPSFASFFADPPKFSPHVAATIAAPAARKSVDSSNGATGPRFDATAPASCPAPIATRLSPKYARPKIWERAAGGSARRVCSETSHASGACG